MLESGENRSLSSENSIRPGEIDRCPESESVPVDFLEGVGDVGALPKLLFLCIDPFPGLFWGVGVDLLGVSE